LVAQGYSEVEGLDFDETFALVARLEAIMILLAYAYSRNIKLYQMDVISDFLNGKISELDEDILHYYLLAKTQYGRGPVVVGRRPCEPHYLSYGLPWAHCLGGYQDRLLGGPLVLPDLRCTAPDGVKHKDYRGEVLG
jgi:hypothetical protein